MLKVHTLNDQLCPHTNNAAHGVEVPPGVRLLFSNGQVGARKDGTVPADPVEQFEIIFERLGHVLAASEMGFADVVNVVKLTVYVTDKEHFDAFQRVRARHMEGHNPPLPGGGPQGDGARVRAGGAAKRTAEGGRQGRRRLGSGALAATA